MSFELGIYTFGNTPETGATAQAIRDAGLEPVLEHPIGSGHVPVHVRVHVVAQRVHVEVPVQPHHQRAQQDRQQPALAHEPGEDGPTRVPEASRGARGGLGGGVEHGAWPPHW